MLGTANNVDLSIAMCITTSNFSSPVSLRRRPAAATGLRTYFITGRASANFVPLDTRLARRTSSTPATFLIPSITNKATNTAKNQVGWTRRGGGNIASKHLLVHLEGW